MMNDTAPAAREAPAVLTSGRAALVLILLTASYTVSFMDRTALGVLQERLKYDLQLSDWELGMMTGPAFAILYAVSGLPLARLAERVNRGRILAACLVIWSGMTMACGLARSFWGLFVARMGVGIGEAGGNPVAHSIMADVFPVAQRARAIAIYSLGAPLGAFLGAALVGVLAQHHDWRTVFMLLGPPGFVLALLVLWLMPRVERTGGSANPVEPPDNLAAVTRQLWAQPAFRHSAAGAALVVLVGYGVAAFLAPLLLREHHLPIARVGVVGGLVNGIAAGVGTLLGGYLSDRLVKQNRKATALLAAAAAVLGAPLLMFGCVTPDTSLAVAALFAGTLAIYCYLAPTFALVYDLAPKRTHATTTAVFYLIMNLLGTGMGPPLIGAASDFLARRAYASTAGATGPFEVTCKIAKGEVMPEACSAAMATGLAQALFWVSGLLLWAGFHFWRASRHVPSEPSARAEG